MLISRSNLLCAVVFGILAYVLRAAHETDRIQMKTEVQE